MSCNVAFIGLGVMGYPMAGYISKGGHNVTVFNRTKSKAEKWINEYKGKMADTPAEAAKDAEYIFTCVGNDNDLREVTFGCLLYTSPSPRDGLLSRMPSSA